MGQIDTLINSAGIARDDLLVKLKENDLDQILNVNLKGSILMGKAVIKSMLRSRTGNIINLGSIVGISGDTGQTAYSASKAGLIGVTKTWAQELGPKGIRVNLIAPGFIETDLTKEISETKRRQILDRVILGRFGKPEDISSTVLFLLNNEYITGQVIIVDGGLGLKNY